MDVLLEQLSSNLLKSAIGVGPKCHMPLAWLWASFFAERVALIRAGGAYGSFVAALMRALPDMKGTLFDVPQVISKLSRRNHSATSAPLLHAHVLLCWMH